MRRLVTGAIQAGLRKMGLQIVRAEHDRKDHSLPVAEEYVERPEYGASNLQTKLDNVAMGLPFEFPDIVNLNHAVAACVTDEKRIVELGSGTGKFATEVARDPTRFVVASEFDADTYEWCLANIPSQKNLRFVSGPVPREMAPFDLSVSIEVVEHVQDFTGFLREMGNLAPKSIITTPNRKRSLQDYHAGPPSYFKHVREWTAGEFFWVLRCFWRDVSLYGLISQSEPIFVKVDVDTALSPLIAICSFPLQNHTAARRQ